MVQLVGPEAPPRTHHQAEVTASHHSTAGWVCARPSHRAAGEEEVNAVFEDF